VIFERVKTPGLAHVAYVLGDPDAAIVVDPRRDVDAYVRLARQHDLTIKFVLETHRQEDFEIGSAELARITGARIVSLDHPLFGHSDIRLRDGEQLTAGTLTIRALHTPGHTPESTCYAVFLEDAPQRAWGVFTGDTLFVGEAGRTDLADPKRTSENAGLLYDAIHAKLAPLGDQTLLWPAHGAGSVCGGNIADRDHSTIGLERVTNPAFTTTRAEFAAAKLAERIPRPPYFALMEKVNLRGGRPVATPAAEVPLLQADRFAAESKQGVVFDAREPEAFAGGHIPGSYGLWFDGIAVFAGWLADEGTSVYLVLDELDQLEDAVLMLARLGVDQVRGVLAGGFGAWREAGLPIARSGTVSAKELAASRDDTLVLDVRDDAEFEEEGHIPGALHLYVGYLDRHLDRLRRELRSANKVTLVCSVGHRAGLAASILQRHGVDEVQNLLGGMTAWEELKLPTETGAERTVTTPDIEGGRR
jgi:hydroxyacylglutathione hydrolase